MQHKCHTSPPGFPATLANYNADFCNLFPDFFYGIRLEFPSFLLTNKKKKVVLSLFGLYIFSSGLGAWFMCGGWGDASCWINSAVKCAHPWRLGKPGHIQHCTVKQYRVSHFRGFQLFISIGNCQIGYTIIKMVLLSKWELCFETFDLAAETYKSANFGKK